MAEPFQAPIDARTRLCAVYGHPVHHSASPAMQNAGLAALGLNWRYLAFDVPPDQLGAALEGALRMNFVGLNLTVPHKLLALPLVHRLDESAETWGAVNTIRFEARDAGGHWRSVHEFLEPPTEVRSCGFNTDADAIVRAIEEDLRVKIGGTRVLLLGAGGAGRTAALKLASAGASELYLVNRTPSKAEVVAKELQSRYPETKVSLGYPSNSVDLLVNATSLGLKPGDELPVDERAFSLSRAGAVFDMIYRPAETPLLAHAKASGCRTTNGLGMLLYQGAKALEIWTGRAAPVEVMRQALVKNVYG